MIDSTGLAIQCHSSTSCAGAYDSGLVGPRLLNVATGGVWNSFVLLPRILGCWGSFARAFLPGRLDFFFFPPLREKRYEKYKSSQVPTLHSPHKPKIPSLPGRRKARAKDPQHPKILGSRTKESRTPPVATSWRRGPTSPESYAPAQLATSSRMAPDFRTRRQIVTITEYLSTNPLLQLEKHL